MEQNTIDLLRQNRKTISENWIKVLMQHDSLREDITINEDIRAQVDELVAALLTAIKNGNFNNIEAPEYDEVIDIISGLSMSRAKQGYSPRETGMFVMSLKTAITNFLLKEKLDDPSTMSKDILEINQLIDNLSIVTFDTYIKGREEVILRQTNEIEEISSPVNHVWEGIVALPIIGTLDSSRTQVVMENLLNEIVNTGSSIAILDISGVPAVDSLVAQHLIKTVSATRLMGAECIISGIKPEIAQTIVHLGIDLSDIITKASLASALHFAFRSLRLEVVSSNKRTNG